MTRRSHLDIVETGQFIGHFLWPPTEVLEEIGAEYLLMHVSVPVIRHLLLSVMSCQVP